MIKVSFAVDSYYSSVLMYNSYEEAESDFFKSAENRPFYSVEEERLVTADAMEIDFPAEKCKVNSALVIDQETCLNFFLEDENINEAITACFEDYGLGWATTIVYELYNVKKFKPKMILVKE